MYTPIENMPPNSRVWVYQSNRKLNWDDEKTIAETLKQFCSQWAAHGADLQASFGVYHHRFVMLAVNEEMASPSGCSIDSSTHVIRNLGQQLDIDFFDRNEIPFLQDGDIVTFPLSDLKKLFADGRLNESAITFNSLVATLGEWRTQSQVKVLDCWVKRYLPKVVA